MKSVLIIDDDEGIRSLLLYFLGEAKFDAQAAGSLVDARRSLAAKAFDAVIVDHLLPDGQGTDLIEEIRAMNPVTAIVVITGVVDVPLAVRAMQKGADNFLIKPVKLDELLIYLQKALDISSLRRSARSRDIADRKLRIGFGASAAMGRVLEMADVATESEHPVLITGETGVGKGVLARWIHENGARRSGVLVEVGCPNFRGELLKSELFGHAKGSFTTAIADQPGLLEAADGGTLFLDEIGEMDLAIQAQFLKVIEDKSYRRIGEIKVRRSEFRLICATNQDLASQVEAGRFRNDLLYRIQMLPIHIPPLRERREDIPAFVEHFLETCKYGYRGLKPAVMDFLVNYDWPGNLRELRYVTERAVLLARGREVEIDHVAGITVKQRPAPATAPPKAESGEAREIRSALHRCDNNIIEAAKTLGISRATLYRRMKKMQINA